MLIEDVSISSITPDENQPRRSIDSSDERELAGSLNTNGQLQPIIVCRRPELDDKLCIDGHLRMRAATLLGWPELRAMVLDELPTPAELVRMQLTANCLRFDLKPSELAISIQQLKQSQGYTNVEVTKYLGMSKSRVTMLLSILKLPEDLIAKVDAGELGVSTAYGIARQEPAERGLLIENARRGKVKRSETVSRKPVARKTTYRFPMQGGDLTIACIESLDLNGLIALFQSTIRELRAAGKRRIDVKTLERVLAAQRAHEASSEALEGASA